jgi:hypothetical protein
MKLYDSEMSFLQSRGATQPLAGWSNLLARRVPDSSKPATPSMCRGLQWKVSGDLI